MDQERSLMAVLAHPDDESLGMGGVLARYAAEGVATHLVVATRGERGRYFTNDPRPGDTEVGRVRELELQAAAGVLGVRDVALLGYLDGDLDRADSREAVARIADRIRLVRPQVIVTFEPFGGYGHPDHIAISQFTTAAVSAAAHGDFAGSTRPPHQVLKLYYFAWSERSWEPYQAAFKTLVSRVDGVERQAMHWPEWAITTRVDTTSQIDTVWRAIQCHRTQMAVYEQLERLSREQRQAIFGQYTFYRAMSLVNGGRTPEGDLFAGIPSHAFTPVGSEARHEHQAAH